MSKQITIITNYFPPESGAASNRISAMVDAFLDNGYVVTVICPLPSYPLGKVFISYRGKLFDKERKESLTIYRLWHMPSNSSSKFIRLFSMLSFCFSLFWFVLFKKLSPVVFVQMSPLFIGFTGVFISRLKRKKIVLNVSDLWPLAGLEMGVLKRGFYYNILESIEKYCYKKTDLILGQSEEILTHIEKDFSPKDFFLYRNFPQDKSNYTSNTKPPSNELKIVYAGLLGVAQGISNLIKGLNIPDGVSISIYGDGPEAKNVAQIALSNPKINYYGVLEKGELDKKLLSYDLALIPLVNRIYGSVPSKIFELSRLGIPIVYFSEGEGALLVEQLELGFVIKNNFKTELEQLIQDIKHGNKKLPMSNQIKETAKNHFDFNTQFEQLLKQIQAV
ncbi:glycosyltransferase family 4 protein [Planktosalinus lacus]|uniref:Glycosyltransferase WbuB n=1 Tax=Planktosalinus lacus TaxID=1526573 RepID=A0A8J2V6K0_9FLAO|nr:glycosyltransferase family 4 protein [Planktosalinus lacus]GGD80030.1 glycosyltransferase WbuB [Planktosalinus lacus]